MIVIPFFTPGLAHTSYLLGGAATGAIVDPRRDIGIYLDAARELGIRITHILETHLHADFISGHLELAARTGATIYRTIGRMNCLTIVFLITNAMDFHPLKYLTGELGYLGNGSFSVLR